MGHRKELEIAVIDLQQIKRYKERMHILVRSGAIAFVALLMPFSAFAWVDYGAWYYTPGYTQQYYQPMYAYSYSPVVNQQASVYNYQPQNVYQSSYGGSGYPNYGYMPQQYSYPQQYYTPQYSYGSPQYGGYSQQWGPSGYGYPTGDTVPWIGGPLCEFPDYNGRALCGSNPNQWVYDPWTGSWY